MPNTVTRRDSHVNWPRATTVIGTTIGVVKNPRNSTPDSHEADVDQGMEDDGRPQPAAAAGVRADRDHRANTLKTRW